MSGVLTHMVGNILDYEFALNLDFRTALPAGETASGGTNGALGTATSVPYYELDGVRLIRAADFFAWLAANGLPGHEWFGGNEI